MSETKEVIAVYKTDHQHSYASRDLLGVATSTDFAISICQDRANLENEKISEDDLYNLRNLKQNQGYANGEFDLDYIETNILY